MSEQFTKGPWLNNGRLIYSKGAVFIATASKTDIEDFQQIEANAALISCAPEMYEMLKALLPKIAGSPAALKINRLLAKARGEA